MIKTGDFNIEKRSTKTKARAGVLHTAHGSINTPVFMPVGTQAAVKGMTTPALDDIGAQIILGNTYHLSLRPGVECIKAHGGLHEFMNWEKPILTDSGGYQVFSLQNNRKITKEGVVFTSHLDGSKHSFTPKRVIDLQLGFNSDIMMPLDICTPYPETKDTVDRDLEQTFLWEREARDYWETTDKKNLLFGLVQGGTYEELREKSAAQLIGLDFPGYAIGGLSVGEPIESLHKMTDFTASRLPDAKPKYLMGVGLPENIRPAIAAGIDMFDCVAPTRLARHGVVFTENGNLTIKNAAYKEDLAPLSETCACSTCNSYSRAYLRHLFMAKEITATTLLTTHNLHWIIGLVNTIREEIKQGLF